MSRHNPQVPDIGPRRFAQLTIPGQHSFEPPLESDPNDPHQPTSLDIRGKIGQTVFQGTKPRRANRDNEPDHVLQRRRMHVPNDPRTHLQLLCRSRFAGAVRAWWTLTDLDRRAYNRKGNAQRPAIEGLNLWIRGFIRSHDLDEFQAEAARREAQTEIPYDGPGP